MEDCIHSLGAACVFTTLDATSAYWKVSNSPANRDKPKLTSHLGTYRYSHMPLGLRNDPTALQHALDIILSGVRCWTCLAYLHDIVIFSKKPRRTKSNTSAAS